MSLRNFRFNLFTFIINILEIVFRDLTITGTAHYYIIITTETTLNGFTVINAESGTTSTEGHFIIQKTSFTLKKEFTTAGGRRRH